MSQFEWDPAKARTNERKHRVKFEDAIKVFKDPNAIFREDFTSGDEERWQVLGLASGVAVLLVIHTVKLRDEDCTEVVRIVSARVATRKEQALYDENRT